MAGAVGEVAKVGIMSECGCGHLEHVGVCGHSITEDIYVSDSAYGGPKYFYRSMIVDICGCDGNFFDD
jgi:hypothetical protein